MKVFTFIEDAWSMGRVHHDSANSLPDMQFTYAHWFKYDWQDVVTKFNDADVCITGMLSVNFFKSCFPQFNLKKCLFVTHGIEFDPAKFPDESLVYGITSTYLQQFFPKETKVFLTPNGVDPANFTYTPRDGSLKKLGWCGAPSRDVKQISWAIEISAKTNIPLSIASKVPCEEDVGKWVPMTYDEVREWYHTVDLLLVTSTLETGPLPAFEAIVSGIPVIGTSVGNFANIPGPKFTSIEEGIEIVKSLTSEKMIELAKEQYDYVMANYTYASFADKWRKAIQYVYSQNEHT